MKILILGAGPCGLGAAYHLNKLGRAERTVIMIDILRATGRRDGWLPVQTSRK